MKRMLAITLALCMIAAASPITAFAAGKMVSTQESFITLDEWGTESYVYARVENTGDMPAEYSSGLFEVYDTNGDTLASTDYLKVHGSVLQPGEYAYVEADVTIDEPHSSADVDDYMLTVTARNGSESQTLRFACEAEWAPDYPVNSYWTGNYMIATFTNTTDDVLYDVSFAFALLDDQNNILYVENESLYDTLGIAAGSTVLVRVEVSDSILEFYENKGVTPTHVDAYAYVEVG